MGNDLTITTWNVNSIRARIDHVSEYLAERGATAAEADAVPADTSGTPPLGGNAVVQFVGLDQKDN